jgi:opacity protein-like surface antigen
MPKLLCTAAFVCLLASPLLAADAFDPATAPHVTGVQGSRPDNSAGLGDRVTVQVQGLDRILAAANGNCHAIVLFLNGIPVDGMLPESCDPYTGTVRFFLDRDTPNDEAWHRLLGSPHGFQRVVRASIGAGSQFSYPTTAMLHLSVIPGPEFYLFVVVLAAALILLLVLCSRTTLIRSTVPPATGGPHPFSLARTQMAFWFFLVICGYVFCWLITKELDTITDSVLALIGIGSGTALGAALIDTTTSPGAQLTATPSRGFLRDVLGDTGGGISMHRFQMFAWTLVLGIIFVSSVYAQLAMPNFNATLLGLMGISSGTYLGFKFPEKKTQDPTTPPGAAAAAE